MNSFLGHCIFQLTQAKSIKTHIQKVLFILCLIIANHAQAYCSSMKINTFNFPVPSTINAIIPSNAPTITPISDWYSYTVEAYPYCPLNEMFDAAISTSYPIIGSYSESGLTYNVYSIRNTNIGFIASYQYQESGSTSPVAILPAFCWSRGTTCLYGKNVPVTMQYRVRIFRTGIGTESITMTSKPIIIWGMPFYPSNGLYVGTGYIPSTTINFQTTSCMVSTSDIQVPLPPIKPAQLSSVGATAGSTPFKVVISCPTSPVNVYMTMTDNSDPGQRSNIISAATGSTTQGVGIQVQHNGTPVYMGPDSSVAGNTNQFLAGNTITSSTSIPFTASYIRTPAAVSAGTLKAVATFTMSYQ